MDVAPYPTTLITKLKKYTPNPWYTTTPIELH